jgi:hypothetical protein
MRLLQYPLRDRKTNSSKTKDKPLLLERFLISAAMRPYVLRVRLRAGRHFDFGKDPESAVRFSHQIAKMRQILVRSGIAVGDADTAIQKTLYAAVDHQLSHHRFAQHRMNEEHSLRVVDQLILELRELRDLISRLPPSAKGKLNQQVAAALDQPTFDSEVFISVIDITEKSLRQASPRRLADDALAKIRPELVEHRTPPLILLWEALPSPTRLHVEDSMQGKQKASLTGWLSTLADLLKQRRPAANLGAPHSTAQQFVRQVRSIWLGLGLKAGLTYKFDLHPATQHRVGRGGRVESGFQSYCQAALAAFGDFSKISARQVVNARNPGD